MTYAGRRTDRWMPVVWALASALALGGAASGAATDGHDDTEAVLDGDAPVPLELENEGVPDDEDALGEQEAGSGPALPLLRGGTPPYRVGERLRFSIYWGPLHVGTSVVEVKEIREVNGRPCYRVVARTRSNAVISAVYPVDDTVETYMDVDGLFSRRFIKKLNEGGYHCDEETMFDVENGIAYWQSYRNGKKKEYAIPDAPQDSLSLVYFLRGHKLEPHSQYKATVCADEEVYELIIESRGTRTLKMSRRAGGRRRAIEVEPKAKFKGIFVRKGRMWVWVSDDESRLLLRMVTKIPLGSLRMVLAEASNVGPRERR